MSVQQEEDAADSVSTEPLQQTVREDDLGVAVSTQQVDYTKARTWLVADNDTGPSRLERDVLMKLRAVNSAVNSARVVSVVPEWSLEGGAQDADRDEYDMPALADCPWTKGTN